MPEPSFQTVQLRRGRHRSPDDGACVMELTSMLAGERFSDRPKTACPVLAAFLRATNDLFEDDERGSLYAYASLAVGTRRDRDVARARALVLVDWVHPRLPQRLRPWYARTASWKFVGIAAAERVMDLPPAERPAAVERLVDRMLAIGATAPPATIVAEDDVEAAPPLLRG